MYSVVKIDIFIENSQINPKLKARMREPIPNQHELVFLADLPPLSIVTYELTMSQPGKKGNTAKVAEMSCTNCNMDVYLIEVGV